MLAEAMVAVLLRIEQHGGRVVGLGDAGRCDIDTPCRPRGVVVRGPGVRPCERVNAPHSRRPSPPLLSERRDLQVIDGVSERRFGRTEAHRHLLGGIRACEETRSNWYAAFRPAPGSQCKPAGWDLHGEALGRASRSFAGGVDPCPLTSSDAS